jgi:hypothetical protein
MDVGDFLKTALQNIPAAAGSPLAFLAYALCIMAWNIIAWRVQRNKQLLVAIQKFPPADRLAALELEMGSVKVPAGLTPEQWLKSRQQNYYFCGFAIRSTSTHATK